jgi:hypothetical protein
MSGVRTLVVTMPPERPRSAARKNGLAFWFGWPHQRDRAGAFLVCGESWGGEAKATLQASRSYPVSPRS